MRLRKKTWWCTFFTTRCKTKNIEYIPRKNRDHKLVCMRKSKRHTAVNFDLDELLLANVRRFLPKARLTSSAAAAAAEAARTSVSHASWASTWACAPKTIRMWDSNANSPQKSARFSLPIRTMFNPSASVF